jgi:fibronectin type 3 domain-containing protein
MRFAFRFVPVLVGLLAVACQESQAPIIVDVDPPAIPDSLTYRLEPSGDPELPTSITLMWDDVPETDTDLESYRVYSRGSTGTSFGLRGETTSNTFHDNGVPHLEYFVTAVDTDGNESDGSNVVNIRERTALPMPAALVGISLNRAVHLSWTDNAFLADPNRFEWYRAYSASYFRSVNECGDDWVLEGTTVAPEFLVGAMTNGISRCFAISAITREGYESLWSPAWQDTPRPDARNVLVFALEEDATQAGFRFWDDANNDETAQASELGIVTGGNAPDVDFRITRDATDTLWIEPVFAGTRMRLYQNQPVADLTSIDIAPVSGYSRNPLQAIQTYGYVFEIVEGANVRYAALRVTHAGRGDYVIFDWSIQTDIDNPELVPRGGLPTVTLRGAAVASSK